MKKTTLILFLLFAMNLAVSNSSWANGKVEFSDLNENDYLCRVYNAGKKPPISKRELDVTTKINGCKRSFEDLAVTPHYRVAVVNFQEKTTAIPTDSEEKPLDITSKCSGTLLIFNY